MDDNLDLSPAPTEESGNRVFLIGAAIFGGVFIIALIAIIGVVIWFTANRTPALPAADQTATAVVGSAATETALFYQAQTVIALTPSATSEPSPTEESSPTLTPTLTETPVVVTTPTDPPPDQTVDSTAEGTSAGTPTVGGAGGETPVGTAAASPTKTPTLSGTPGTLPETGFGDSSGLPMLVSMGVALLVVVVLSRQLRLRRAGR